GRAGLAFHLTTSLWVFWRLKGQLYLGYERFRALAALEPRAVHQRAAAQGGMANFAQLLGNRTLATNHATLALALYREATLPGGEIMASGMLAEIAAEGGNYAESRDRWQEAMTLVRDEGAPGFSMALALIGLGVTEYWDENLDEAERLLHEALEALGGIVTWHRGSAQIRLGSVARRRGLVDAALTEIREGLRVVDRLGGGQEVAQGLEELAAVEHVMEHPDRAATFLGAASALRDSTRSSPAAADAKSNETLTAALQAALGEAAFASAWVSGRALSRSAVLQLAASDLPAAGPFVAPLSSLTGRELEVAQLVAAGLSNAQIAAELVISDATARTHVERIRGKLGVHSRVQIARLVLDSPVESARSD
ncbi:MAG: LuxR C-terminal-related transcriptional regulator, partial [Dehalococcoidia bacterium]